MQQIVWYIEYRKDKHGNTASRDQVQSPLKSLFKDYSIYLVCF